MKNTSLSEIVKRIFVQKRTTGQIKVIGVLKEKKRLLPRHRYEAFHKLRLHFLGFDHVRTPPSLHFLCSKFSIFLTTYLPLNANVICEGSLKPMLYQPV